MVESVCLSLDAMGGDYAPQSVIEGAALALKRLPHLRFLLFGDAQKLSALLENHPKLRDAAEIRHTDNAIAMDEKASVALRKGRDSSMRLAINAVKEGEAQGVISAGNTGALMAMAKFVLKTVPGIDRPAIAGILPTACGESVMLDMGANVDCNANHLMQFAVMGEVFYRSLYNVSEPSVGLLNIGIEEVKGNEEVKNAAQTLRDSSLPIKFHGFIEGDDIAFGVVDVIVTDGFTGNVALKVIEGTSKFISQSLRDTFRSSLPAMMGYALSRPALNMLRRKMDPRRYNGALLLGLNGIAVKSHGSADALGFSTAISTAYELVVSALNNKIIEELAALKTTPQQGVLDDTGSQPRQAAI